MPTSEMKAVPPGRIWWSAVGTWVWVPTTRLARPSQKWPIACFSLVASQWMSTMMASADCLSGQTRKLTLDRGERVVERVHEHPPHHVDDEHTRAVAGVDQRGATARRAGRKVDRPQQPRLALDEDQRLLLIPRVVADGHDVGAGIEEFLVDRLGDAEAAGSVLAIDRDEIEPPVAHEAGQALDQGLSSAAADDVADEENAHASGSFHENRRDHQLRSRARVRLSASDSTEKLLASFDRSSRDGPISFPDLQLRNRKICEIFVELADRLERLRNFVGIFSQGGDHEVRMSLSRGGYVEDVTRLNTTPAIINLLGDDFWNGL